MTDPINLKDFIINKMKMTGPYQALVILNCLQNNGEASLETVAKDLSSRDQESIDYYIGRLKVHPKQVLKSHNVAHIADKKFILDAKFKVEEKDELINLCFKKLSEWYLKNSTSSNQSENNGWGLLRFNLLAKYKKCLLCGARPTFENDVELDVDHIIPKSKGGSDTLENLQILCSRCNRAKSNTSNEDFRELISNNLECIFCKEASSRTILKNDLFWVIRDNFAVTPLHTLIIPKIHIASPFEMDEKHWKELGRISGIVRESIISEDEFVKGFNLGFNDGEVAGQTIFHVHFHVIPRRVGDHENPRGGIRGIIPSKKEY